jgi:beta-galactosidase
MPGGMLPWASGHGYTRTDSANKLVKMPPFTLGRKGWYYTTAKYSDIYDKQAPAYTLQEGGKTLVQNNNATLAYIAGASEAFTEKAHSFGPQQVVEKQLFFFNDTRQVQKCVWSYTVTVAHKIISQNAGECWVPVGDKKSERILFTSPTITGFKADGNIIVTAQIAGNSHTDTLNFRVFNNEAIQGSKKIYVFDPVGKTSQMLGNLGYTIQPWAGQANIPLLIIGTEVLSQKYKLPLPLQAFIQNGGKAIVFNQQDSVLQKSGFRVAKYVSRYVFPIPNNPITQQLDELDLRNWAGTGTLNTAYPDYMNNGYEKSADDSPIYGWHWGNRGSVATNAIEKPHNSSWTPLLECEFDMAYSPLMELNYGKGKLIWCSLDVEDHADKDPIAQILTKRLITYAQNTLPAIRNRKTIFIGNSHQHKLLDDVGLNYTTTNTVENNADLIICGNLSQQQQSSLIQYVQNGGNVFILPQSQKGNYLGVEYALDTTFDGGKTVSNSKITKGLSVSDIRYRTATPSILLSKGCTIALGGLLGEKQIGKGQIVYCQLNPDGFNADTLTYNRYTRWRQTRAFTQILSNMGASFTTDGHIFKEEKKEVYSIDLDKTIWKAKITLALPAVKDVANKHQDPGISKAALELVKPDADETDMLTTTVPNTASDKIYNYLQSNDGEAVFRKTIDIPASMAGKNLELVLGVVDDFDNTYFNGELIGITDSNTKDTWDVRRVYNIPAKLVKIGKNTIAVRVFDWYGGGGLLGVSPKREIKIKNPDTKKVVGLYYPDYRTDFDLGDNPFRYFRW